MQPLEKLEKWAPDPGTWERARPLAYPKRWKDPGVRGDLCWGLSRTGTATLHKVVVRFSDDSFFCSCSVRKKPCKHVLALASLAVETPEALENPKTVPEWVTGNLDRLEQKSTPQEAAVPPSPEALEQRRRNREKRLERMSQGMEELERWLRDTVRHGLGQLDGQAEQSLERFAARMVDAKLGSVGRRIRTWKKLLGQSDWQEQLLGEMADLFLLLRTFQRSESLPEELNQDLFQIAGLTIKKEEVLSNGAPVSGRWTVLGVVGGEEENLRFRRTWVQEEKTAAFALFLDFAWGDQPFADTWKPGRQFDGSLVYYPSAYPLRALLQSWEEVRIRDYQVRGIDSLDAMAEQYAEALSLNPWLPRLPVLLENVRPVKGPDGHWILLDLFHKFLPLSCPDPAGWMLLAMSGGQDLTLFGEWDGATLLPLSCLSSGRLVELC